MTKESQTVGEVLKEVTNSKNPHVQEIIKLISEKVKEANLSYAEKMHFVSVIALLSEHETPEKSMDLVQAMVSIGKALQQSDEEEIVKLGALLPFVMTEIMKEDLNDAVKTPTQTQEEIDDGRVKEEIQRIFGGGFKIQ